MAIIITSATYIAMAIAVGATVSRDATGNLTDIVNGSSAFLDCLPGILFDDNKPPAFHSNNYKPIFRPMQIWDS